MVVVRLKEGLGNQLFQYAVGRTLADRQGQRLRFDTSFYYYHSHRQYELGNFKVRGAPGWRSRYLVPLLRTIGKHVKIPLDGQKLYAGRRWHQVLEQAEFGFQDLNGVGGKNVYLDGYWQNVKYFESNEARIRSHLLPKAEARGDFELVRQRILEGGDRVVALHLRRGDYLQATNQFQLCSYEYYRRALETMKGLLGAFKCYVFTDDPKWLKNNPPYQNFGTPVDELNALDAVSVLSAMRLCSHFIIANSTFSWWAAWLGDNRKKIVVAPKCWSAYPSVKTDGLYPPDWIRL